MATNREESRLTLGVDAQKRIHAAVALDAAGQVAAWRGPNRPEGWADLLAWAVELGAVRQWGIEGAGQDGRGLAQYVVAAGEAVWEVNPRQTAAMRRGGRQRGKRDRVDAQAVVPRATPSARPCGRSPSTSPERSGGRGQRVSPRWHPASAHPGPHL